VINATDEESGGVLGRASRVEVAQRTEGFIWLKPQRPGAFSIAFQRVAEPTEGRRRLHLDTSLRDLETATAGSSKSGATPLRTKRSLASPGGSWPTPTPTSPTSPPNTTENVPDPIHSIRREPGALFALGS
jgi:glyoxalase superfamily protein